MKQFLKKAKAIVAILILTLCFSGCENSDDNLPVITAGFTHTINPYTGTVTFINTSSDVKYYLWTFGDGTTSTEINPTKTYVDGNYTVVLEIKNVAGASDSYEDTIIIGIVAAPDTVAPVITLVGSPKIDVVVGGTFTDPGTTASDNVDGDITSRVVVAGDAVNVNKAGTYVITYNVSDASANAATQVTRTVTVAEDTVRPVITLTGNSTINVALGGTFTDPGATASDNVDGNISNRIVVAGDTVNTNKEGTYVITYNVKDAAANAATQVTRTVIVTAAGSGGGGGVGADGNLAVNGDFETGNTSGWTTFVDAAGASFRASTTQPKAGSYSGNLVADFSAGNGGAVDAVVKQANMGAGGTSTPNTEYIVSFDLRGSTGEGGDFFVEFFSELSGGGVSKAEIITGKPHITPTAWTKYSYTVRTGSDVSGGITLQLKSSCGPVNGCVVNVFFDNVSVKLK
jgi:PKD repeat protein